MKFEVYTITAGVESSILETNKRSEAVIMFLKMQQGERRARLRISGRQLTIVEADRYVLDTRRCCRGDRHAT